VKRIVLALSAALLASSAASAQKYIGSPAQDLFDQAVFFLDTQYFGPSKINLPDLFIKYQANIDAECATLQLTCGFDKAEPVVAQMFEDVGAEDPHTYYLSSQAVAQENANRSGQQTSPTPRIGIGLRGFCETLTGNCEFGADGNLISKFIPDRMVSNVTRGGPADKAGIKYGDRWIGYNDVVFSSARNIEEFNKLFQDFTTKVRASETVNMQIVRGLERQKLTIPLKGEIINLSEQPYLEIRPDGIGIITLKDYQIRGVAQKMHELVKEAVSKGVKGIIYNQRSNPGGNFLETIASAGAFVAKPDLMRWTTRYNSEKNIIEWGYENGRVFARNLQGGSLGGLTIENATVYTGPLAVMVDSGCASGCEYFASYIQRAKRAPVIGSPTVGIGNTNTARFDLINGGAAAMPTIKAIWSSDSKDLPAQIQPDLLVADFEYKLFNTGKDDVLEKALEAVGVKSTLNQPANFSTTSSNAGFFASEMDSDQFTRDSANY
jgi:carboxyl-terminal processing protease